MNLAELVKCKADVEKFLDVKMPGRKEISVRVLYMEYLAYTAAEGLTPVKKPNFGYLLREYMIRRGIRAEVWKDSDGTHFVLMERLK